MNPTTRNTRFAKYPAYKDSGVEWLGEIPVGWEAVRMKFLFRDVSIKNKPEEELLSVTQDKGVVPRTWVENRMVMPSGNLKSFKYIRKGDFAISLRSFEGGLEYCHHDGIISPAYTVLKKGNGLVGSFYRYLFKSFSFISEIQTSVVGIREGKNISYPELSYSLLPIPPLSEQTAIATFLDDKTAKIDRAIAQKEQLIALLQERKQIIIQDAVTGQVKLEQGQWIRRPKSEMKDSGVEWIGEIPVGWEVKRLKYCTEIFRGKFTHRPRNDQRLYNGIYPFFQTGDVAKAGKFLYKFKQSLNEYGLRVSTLIPKGTIVVTIAANIGDISILGLDACFPDSIVGLKPESKIKRDMLYYILLVMKEQFMNSTIKNTQMNLNVDRIGNNYIPLPPLRVQSLIIQHIETQSTKTDQAIALQQTQIQKLKEYKATLIDSAVTGKIKVVN
jgi:type I restriction enzyme S subunit